MADPVLAWYTESAGAVVLMALAAVQNIGIDPRLATYYCYTNGGLTGGTLGSPTIGFGVGKEEHARRLTNRSSSRGCIAR